MSGVLPFDEAYKRQQIEAVYHASTKAWQEQYEIAVRLLRAERDVKCAVALSNRDQQMRALTGEDMDMLWPGIA
jgi:hypothetical protein